MRTVNRFVTPGAPASSATEPAGVFLSADENPSAGGLLLEVALHTKNLITLNEHPRVGRTVSGVASGAAFPDGFVLEHERPALRRVALSTSFKFGGE